MKKWQHLFVKRVAYIQRLKMPLDGGTRPGATTPTHDSSLQWEMGKQTHLDGGTLHPGQPC